MDGRNEHGVDAVLLEQLDMALRRQSPTPLCFSCLLADAPPDPIREAIARQAQTKSEEELEAVRRQLGELERKHAEERETFESRAKRVDDLQKEVPGGGVDGGDTSGAWRRCALCRGAKNGTVA
jgi:hypothetical protein